MKVESFTNTAPIEEVGFIIPRCVKSKAHNFPYKECYSKIRQHHPTLKIVFIDDNSDKSILEEIPMTNVEIIQSEYHGAGEYLPYYYLLTRKLFKKAIIIQDSWFVNDKIPYEKVTDYLFMYHDVYNKNQPWFNKGLVDKLFNHTKIPSLLHERYKNIHDPSCWGSCMIVTHDFLLKVENLVGISKWKDVIKDRNDRIALECALAVVFLHVKDNKDINYSLYGFTPDLESVKYEHSVYNVEKYLQNKQKLKDKIIKVWNGR